MTQTVFATATPLPATAALMRVSGPLCQALHRALGGKAWIRGTCRTSFEGAPCVLWTWPGPRSYSGEDTLELLIPGNTWLLSRLEAWLAGNGCQPAPAGEFTRRALIHGRVTPGQAQATLALISASDDSARRAALSELTGDAARSLRDIAGRLRAIAARLEMLLDFSEEEHARPEEDSIRTDLARLTGELHDFCSRQPQRPPRPEPVAALFGPPNAGKSSLFNALLGLPRALVSPSPGTTRDPVTARWQMHGLEVQLVDLSGVGESDADTGQFANAAVDRALQADLLLMVAPGAMLAEARREYQALEVRDRDLAARCIWVETKADIAPPGGTGLRVSALTGAGLNELRVEMHRRLLLAARGSTPSLLRTNAARASAALTDAARDDTAPPEATAAEVRHALTLLDEALLEEMPGEVLDLIFSGFCIGK